MWFGDPEGDVSRRLNFKLSSTKNTKYHHVSWKAKPLAKHHESWERYSPSIHYKKYFLCKNWCILVMSHSNQYVTSTIQTLQTLYFIFLFLYNLDHSWSTFKFHGISMKKNSNLMECLWPHWVVAVGWFCPHLPPPPCFVLGPRPYRAWTTELRWKLNFSSF